jgi:glycerol-3-phosphate dehydrogenase (NAD(P)+)
MPEKVTFLGAGGWGTALALLLREQGHQVRLWAHDPKHARELAESRENPAYLPGFRLPADIEVTPDFRCLLEAGVVVLAVPSAHLRKVLEEARPFFRPGQLLVNAAKGIEAGSLLTMSELCRQVLEPKGSGFHCGLATLSGPSHAQEVAARLPASVVAASDEPKAAARTQALFSASWFRVYTSRDLKGVELGGSLKNVIALAAGIADGLGLGHNARAALVTRGLAEITRLGLALGAQASTFAGLAGLGDLVLTCTSGLSRNRALGEALGKGGKWPEAGAGMKQVAEGVGTAVSADQLAARAGVELPICQEVRKVLFEGKAPRQALEALMARSPKPEEA